MGCQEPVANSATHLGLHNNFISKIENLAILVHLRYLNLAHNQISVVENLSPLKALQVRSICSIFAASAAIYGGNADFPGGVGAVFGGGVGSVWM